jgi:hypothetical protein
VARVILSDQGSNFTSTLLKQLYEMLGVRYLVPSSITVKIYLFPFLVRLNGPTISIAIVLNGSLMIGVFTIGTLTFNIIPF